MDFIPRKVRTTPRTLKDWSGRKILASMFLYNHIADNLFGESVGLEVQNVDGGDLVFEVDEHGNAACFHFHPITHRWEQIWARTVQLVPPEVAAARVKPGESAHLIRGRYKEGRR